MFLGLTTKTRCSLCEVTFIGGLLPGAISYNSLFLMRKRWSPDPESVKITSREQVVRYDRAPLCAFCAQFFQPEYINENECSLEYQRALTSRQRSERHRQANEEARRSQSLVLEFKKRLHGVDPPSPLPHVRGLLVQNLAAPPALKPLETKADRPPEGPGTHGKARSAVRGDNPLASPSSSYSAAVSIMSSSARSALISASPAFGGDEEESSADRYASSSQSQRRVR